MFARLQCSLRRCAAVAEMNVIIIVGDRQVHVWKFGVDDQVMMPRLGCVLTGGHHRQAINTKGHHNGI